MSDREKAPADGVYHLGDGQFRIKKGEPLPPGATFAREGDEAPVSGRRAKRPPENKAEPAAPENKAKAAPENR